MITTHGLTHVALAVRDPERSLQFYQDVVGAVAVYRDEDSIQAQTPGSRDVLVFERAPERAGVPGGVAHFGFRLVEPIDVQSGAAIVEHAGGTVLRQGEFCPGAPFLFFLDPDGYESSLVSSRPRRSTRPRQSPGACRRANADIRSDCPAQVATHRLKSGAGRLPA